MIYNSNETERNAAFRAAELMTAAARTAPKACGIDVTETLVLDGADKDKLTATMREIGADSDRAFFVRDAGNVDACHCVVLIGTAVNPRGLNCSLCGVADCTAAKKSGIPCAMAVNDLGIAVGSAAATAMDFRIDNRVLFTAGMAALKLGLFSVKVKMCFGIGLSVSGKNVFFDRKPI
ncbi:ferredoxin [Clostridia bacterium]|nr:ferredoxin [Clostridia bacterium]